MSDINQLDNFNTKNAKLFIMIESVPWDNNRRKNAINICQYFNDSSFDVPCMIFDAFDMRKLTNYTHWEYDKIIKSFVFDKNMLSEEYINNNWKNRKGKIGHIITTLLMYQYINNTKLYDKFDYFLILQDDVYIENMTTFSDKLINVYLSKIKQNEEYKDLDILQLYSQQRGQCNGWFSYYFMYTNIDYNNIGLFKNRNEILMYFAYSLALVYSPKALKTTLYSNMPIDKPHDLWLESLIQYANLQTYTICPPLVEHGHFESVISSLNN